jgi:hypothetical protein
LVTYIPKCTVMCLLHPASQWGSMYLRYIRELQQQLDLMLFQLQGCCVFVFNYFAC